MLIAKPNSRGHQGGPGENTSFSSCARGRWAVRWGRAVLLMVRRITGGTGGKGEILVAYINDNMESARAASRRPAWPQKNGGVQTIHFTLGGVPQRRVFITPPLLRYLGRPLISIQLPPRNRSSVCPLHKKMLSLPPSQCQSVNTGNNNWVQSFKMILIHVQVPIFRNAPTGFF